MYVQAAEWIELLGSRRLDTVTRRRLQNWLEADPAHRELLRRMIVSWADPALLQTLKRYEKSKWFFLFNTSRGLATLTGVSLMLLFVLSFVLGSYYYLPFPASEVSAPKMYVSGYESKQYQLCDGSSVTQSAAGEMVVDMTAQARHVLLNTGAAFFNVASDQQRPFKVQVQASLFTAVGTQFSIDKTSRHVELTVYEGAVELRAKPQAKPELLRAGEKIRIINGIVQVTEQVDVLKIVDWRSGWIEMKGEPLSYLLEQLNRYSRPKVKVMQRELSNLPVAGRFQLTDMAATLDAVSHFYSLSAQKKGDFYLLSGMHNAEEFTSTN